MFHGTRFGDPKLILGSLDGIDKKWSNDGLHGFGCYFAHNSNYSDNGYTWTNPETGYKEMIICEVYPGKLDDDE